MDENKTQIKNDGMLLIFQVGSEYYAIDATHASGINPMPEVITKMPHAKDYMVGIAPIQGQSLPIIDLAKVLGLNIKIKAQEQQIFRIISEETQKSICAVLVDRVVEIRSAKSIKMLPLPQLNSFLDNFIESVFEVNKEGEEQKLISVIRLRDYIAKLEKQNNGTQEAS